MDRKRILAFSETSRAVYAIKELIWQNEQSNSSWDIFMKFNLSHVISEFCDFGNYNIVFPYIPINEKGWKYLCQ